MYQPLRGGRKEEAAQLEVMKWNRTKCQPHLTGAPVKGPLHKIDSLRLKGSQVEGKEVGNNNLQGQKVRGDSFSFSTRRGVTIFRAKGGKKTDSFGIRVDEQKPEQPFLKNDGQVFKGHETDSTAPREHPMEEKWGKDGEEEARNLRRDGGGTERTMFLKGQRKSIKLSET